ncbi:cytoplasmic protein [Lactarius akahatsu]|uniref:Cytoplasmic protein n=1 Tax=Lactarius akahatsu TaxID=416441 RepID=A0AAD4LD18_9AGAM|nr:cytoplasmic protein [Lactarius akahatsu]
MSSTGPTSSSRALEAILPLVAAGQPYEAHQKARTFAARYTKSGAHAITIDVLFQSARELLKAGNPGSGTDLTLLLLESYERANEPVGDVSRGRITQLIALVGPSGAWRKSIIDRSVAWSAKQGGYPAGDPALQHYIGDLLHKENDFVGAEPHLLAAGTRDSARLLAQVYFDWAKASNSLESHAGTFALRAVLPYATHSRTPPSRFIICRYLLNGNILAARTFLGAFIPYVSSSGTALPIGSTGDEITFTPDPLLNFAQLAVRSVQRAAGSQNRTAREAWIRLCGTYQSRSALLAQPEIRVVLDELGTLYFDLQPPRTANANPFGDIMSSLFGGAPGSSVSATAPRTITPGAVRAQLALD